MKNLKKLKELSQDPNVVIVFQDEVHFSVEATITRQWFAKGSRPKIRSYPGRKAIAYSGFVIPKTGQLFTVKPDWFNFQTTIDSIRQFIDTFTVETSKKIHLIMDNAPWHKKAKRLIESEEEYADIRNSIIIESMPPYSPDLNPIEQVWRVTRREKTHNRYRSGLPILIDVLDKWFDSFKNPNEKIASLCSFL